MPKDEFQAQLEMGLARVAFKEKRWADAEKFYNGVIENHAQTSAVPEAIYWSGVSHYKGTNDHTILTKTAERLSQTAPQNVWAKKASPWLGN